MEALSRNFQSQQSILPLSDVQSGTGIRVLGNTISWPSGGKHEVQYASSLNTVSEGGQSATLDPGVYTVINHSTGERFENIVIGQEAGGAPQSQSSLDGLRDSPSTTDRLSGSDGTTDTDNNANSGRVDRNVFSYGGVECSYDTPPGVTSEGELVEDYGPCAGGVDETVETTVSVQYGEKLPRDMAISCLAGGLAAGSAAAYIPGAPVSAPVAGLIGCALPAAVDIAKDGPTISTITTITGND